MRAGEGFLLELDANPTTGYRWEAEFDPALLCLLSEEYVRGVDRPGAGGVQRFRFQAVGQGRGPLHLRYRSAWRSATADEHEVSVTVVGPK
ncbi:MAG: protease inhibitor I42 family protein [Thermoplasmata archaeon]|nr:protease inhibitor I42 family protein [Thermoplasmata archaeon]